MEPGLRPPADEVVAAAPPADVTDGILGAGDTLTMRAFHGILRFNAPVTSRCWRRAPRRFGAARLRSL